MKKEREQEVRRRIEEQNPHLEAPDRDLLFQVHVRSRPPRLGKTLTPPQVEYEPMSSQWALLYRVHHVMGYILKVGWSPLCS